MVFIKTKLDGAFIIELKKIRDKRGFFARSWCRQEFIAHGLSPELVQCNVSFNKKKGTLRGMHFQVSPHEEDKLIRCTMGSIDLRPESPTFKQHIKVVLSANNRKLIYVPKGFANGYQTLNDNTEVFYQMSQTYDPQYHRGVRWNDPAFKIKWPIDDPIMLERDQNYPDFKL